MEENDKTFEAYFSGKMRSAQANDFTTALQANPELKKRYDEFVAIKQASKKIERDNFRQLLNEVDIEKQVDNKNTPSSSSSTIIPMLSRIAGIAAIFLIGFWGYSLISTPNNNDIFNQNFEIYHPQQTRGHEGYSDIFKPYQDGDYMEAILQCAGKSLTAESRMMLANAYIMEEKFDKAEVILSNIDLNSTLRDQVYWYQSLVYIKLGKKTDAMNKLKLLETVSNYKKQEVKDLIKFLQ